MEEREKIIKKTTELVLKDIKGFFFPIFKTFKLYIFGLFIGVSFVLVNGIGRKISKDLKEGLSWNDGGNIFMGQVVGIIVLTGFLLTKSVGGDYGWVVKLLVISNLIGIAGVTYNYLSNKKIEAINLIDKKEEKIDEKIKIEKPKILNEAINR